MDGGTGLCDSAVMEAQNAALFGNCLGIGLYTSYIISHGDAVSSEGFQFYSPGKCNLQCGGKVYNSTTRMSLQGKNACSKERHTDLSAAVNICFLWAPRTNTLLQGSKFGPHRQTKLLELIIQSSPQELLAHFIFFNLKECTTYLETSQKYNPSTNTSHQKKKKK